MKRAAIVILGAFIGVLGLLHEVKSEDLSYLSIGPFGTLNNTDSPLVIPNTKAQDLLNVEISPEGGSVKKRKGFRLRILYRLHPLLFMESIIFTIQAVMI